MAELPRLIEFAFPLRQASLDSVHEKSVRHGHISTLHIWPARRPLAACRAALIATLLPDPGTPEGRRKLCERIGGRVVKRIEKKKMPDGSIVEREKQQTEGGILHWLGEEPASGGKKKRDEWKAKKQRLEQELEWFREQIREANGGRAPKVLDPFSGGGAIPLEAMRLGCAATAIDINPVAWFILKCTLEYPQGLAGQHRRLPAFILKDRGFMEGFFKSQGLGKGDVRNELERLGHTELGPCNETPSMFAAHASIEADLAWHVRAWGQWVLGQARKELARFYPTYADFEPLDPNVKSYEKQPTRLVNVDDDGVPDQALLNGEFSDEYLAVKSNPRWVAKPTVAYLWSRTVTCKNCRCTIPLLKTRWLCKKARKRVMLSMEMNRDKSGVVFGIEMNVPIKGNNGAQRREHDKRVGAGTMTGAGAKCPGCETIMTWDDLRIEGQAQQFGQLLLATVVNGTDGKEYRLPHELEHRIVAEAESVGKELFAALPFGLPVEPTPEPFGPRRHGAALRRYGMMRWADVFTSRQLLAIATFATKSRLAEQAMLNAGYALDWVGAIASYLALAADRLADYSSAICSWHNSGEKLRNTFSRFAFPIIWDFAEVSPIGDTSGGYAGAIEWISLFLRHGMDAACSAPPSTVVHQSSTRDLGTKYDVILTDPPYYDAISYCDLMDFFHVWLRRITHGLSPDITSAFRDPLGPKWDHASNDGELVDDPSRHGWDRERSKSVYEDGMYRTFLACHAALEANGRFVVVFAHKHSDAWETLVSAIIRAGFVVDASWPIQTEMGNRARALTSSALASSVWLVCKKRPATARPGWDNKVLDDMRAKIGQRLRDFWDADIRGPDFVWAATGPALEAYSAHPVVKMADEAGKVMTVSDFLSHARRMVVDFVVGRVLSGDDSEAAPAMDRLDEPTAYYLLHRHDFGLEEAPAGACILYATACGLSDDALVRDWDILMKTGGDDFDEDDDDEEEFDESAEPPDESGSGSKVKLKPWNHRRGRSMGLEAPGGRPVPLIDRIHRLMHLWKGGDVHKVDEYLDEHGLRRHELFRRVLQSLIELSRSGGDERSILESLSNHVGAKGAKRINAQSTFLQPEEADV